MPMSAKECQEKAEEWLNAIQPGMQAPEKSEAHARVAQAYINLAAVRVQAEKRWEQTT